MPRHPLIDGTGKVCNDELKVPYPLDSSSSSEKLRTSQGIRVEPAQCGKVDVDATSAELGEQWANRR